MPVLYVMRDLQDFRCFAKQLVGGETDYESLVPWANKLI